jgi:hypothetical protein
MMRPELASQRALVLSVTRGTVGSGSGLDVAQDPSRKWGRDERSSSFVTRIECGLEGAQLVLLVYNLREIN